jgi:hypothetical protein
MSTIEAGKKPASLEEDEREEIRRQIKLRRLATPMIENVSKKVGREISRNNLSLLYKEGANTPLRELLFQEYLDLI